MFAYQGLEEGYVMRVTPPNIHVMMSAVWQASQDRQGDITLDYIDGTTETAPAADHDITTMGFFAIIDLVQGKRNTPR